MPYQEIDSLRGRVQTELPSCPPPLILETAVRVIREFCQDTQLWTVELDPIRVKEGITDYILDGVPGVAEIWRPVKVELDGVEIQPETGYTMVSATELRLVTEPPAEIDDGLEVTVSLRPRLTATSIDRRLYEDWHEAWREGILAELMAMPGKRWSSRQDAEYHRMLYGQLTAGARFHEASHGMNQDLQARPRWGFL